MYHEYQVLGMRPVLTLHLLGDNRHKIYFNCQFCHSRPTDNTFLTATDYTQHICGLVECVMPGSLYSRHAQSFAYL